MIKNVLIKFFVLNLIFLNCNAIVPETHQAKLREFQLGGEVIYQIITPNQGLIQLTSAEVGREYFNKNKDEDAPVVKASCGFGVAFIAHSLETLLTSAPNTPKDKLYEAFYNAPSAEFENRFIGLDQPQLTDKVYRIASDKFKDFFKKTIPLVIDYRRNKGVDKELYHPDLTGFDLDYLLQNYQPIIQNIKDKIVLIDADYDPYPEAPQEKKQVLENKIKTVIEDPTGKSFIIFLCGINLTEGGHWVSIIIRKNPDKNIEIMYADTENWVAQQFTKPIFHVMGIIKKLTGSQTFKDWIQKLKTDIDEACKISFDDDLINKTIGAAKLRDIDTFPKISAEEDEQQRISDWFKKTLEELTQREDPSVFAYGEDQNLKDFALKLNELYLKPRCRNCSEPQAKLIALPCGMTTAQLLKRPEFDHCYVCQKCLQGELFSTKMGAENSARCPECNGFITQDFRNLVKDKKFSDEILLACAMYYGDEDSEQTRIADIYLNKFIPNIPNRNQLISDAKKLLPAIREAQKNIKMTLAACNYEDLLRKPIVGDILENLKSLFQLPNLGDEWAKKQISNYILKEGGRNAEKLTLRLLELDTEVDKIINKLLEWSDTTENFNLDEFLKKDINDILKNRKEEFEKYLENEKNETLAKIRASGLRSKLTENQIDKNVKDKESELKKEHKKLLQALTENDTEIGLNLALIHTNQELHLKPQLKKLSDATKQLKSKLQKLQNSLKQLGTVIGTKKKK